MSKSKRYFMCIACGSDFSKWHGRCPDCGEWNAIVEAENTAGKKGAAVPEPSTLASVESADMTRITTGISEFNVVSGGGIVPGSVLLIGGEPGIGKTTLAMEVAGFFRTLYISVEESPAQIKHRAERLKVDTGNISVLTSTVVQDIISAALRNRPEIVIVDSIQTVCSREIPGIAGSVSQIRESASKLVDFAKTSGIPVILIGHITKDGAIAGPRLLEHLVDTVLYFEGDFTREFRILRAFKNRFGSVNEIGLFEMTGEGLSEVRNKNAVFLNPSGSTAPGSAVSAALEGSRTILFEVQSLVTFSTFANPRRMADGLDLNRLALLAAVLEKHGGLKLGSFDVFINVSGGFQINETSADLAVAAAVASSLKESPVPRGMGLLGEISLSGEVRPVSQCGRRAVELKHGGFNALIVSAHNRKDIHTSDFEGTVIGVKSIRDALEHIFS